MMDLTYRRAQNSDSESIKHILETTFREYEISLPDGYSFADVENLEAVGLYRKFGFINHVGAKLSPGHDIGLILRL